MRSQFLLFIIFFTFVSLAPVSFSSSGQLKHNKAQAQSLSKGYGGGGGGYDGDYGGGGSSSCSVGERRVWCRDLHVTPSVDREIFINGCSVSCSNQARPVCLSGYPTGSHCDDYVEPSQCYCN